MFDLNLIMQTLRSRNIVLRRSKHPYCSFSFLVKLCGDYGYYGMYAFLLPDTAPPALHFLPQHHHHSECTEHGAFIQRHRSSPTGLLSLTVSCHWLTSV